MKKTVSKSLKTWVLFSLAIFVGGTFTGCQDEVDQSNRFTFTGDLISTYLEDRPEQFSHFVKILEKASIGNGSSQGTILKTLSTYGAYTCIAPTNSAVEKFVADEYNNYLTKENVDENDKTLITSPDVNDLTPEVCTKIAKNHIIEGEFKTADFSGSVIRKPSMNNRDIEIRQDITSEGDILFYLGGKDNALVTESDILTYNGTIHVVSSVLNPSEKGAAEILNGVGSLSIFYDAIVQTGLSSLLNRKDKDENYDPYDESMEFGQTGKGKKAAFPQYKDLGYTLLIEPNEVLSNPKNNYYEMEINTWQDLAKFAEKIYGSEPGYERQYTHPKNALFKYIAYHIIDRQLIFAKGAPRDWIMEQTYINKSCENGGTFKASENMDRGYNWHDYFETYLPYSEWEYNDEELEAISNGIIDEGCILKVTKAYTDPSFDESDVILNYCNTTPSDLMRYHTNIKVIDQEDAATVFPESMKDHSTISPTNASIHFLDKILVYNEEEMIQNVIKERMRWDMISCFPELTTNRVRWTQSNKFVYIPSGDGTPMPQQNKTPFCKRLRALNPDTEIFYLPPCQTSEGAYTSYQGDEFLIEGKGFYAEYRLPHVPQGTYEVRIGFSMSNRRGVIQFYLNNRVCGIPVDMRNDESNKNRIGWFSDKDENGVPLASSEIADAERALRNRGYMKAPASITYGSGENIHPFRETNNAMRRILVTNHEFTPRKGGWWVQVKNVTENDDGNKEYNHDYLEIVPKSIYNDPGAPEDIY